MLEVDKNKVTVIKVSLHFPKCLMDDERLFLCDCLNTSLSQLWKMIDHKYLPALQEINFKNIECDE